MEVFVHDPHAMIAAPVQCNVYGIPKWAHYARIPSIEFSNKVKTASSTGGAWALAALLGG